MNNSLEKRGETEVSAAEVPPAGLSKLEIETIELFINFLRMLGLPKSIGEIYGLLFASPRPLAADEMMAKLGVSAGAASQGLRLLRTLGAVKLVYLPGGGRKDYFTADLDLSTFASVFLKDEVQPRLDRAVERLKRMEELMADVQEADREATRQRVARLRHWIEKGRSMLPWILRFLVT